jgi:pimeloyl-ACP methyl ester carboxylesterase
MLQFIFKVPILCASIFGLCGCKIPYYDAQAVRSSLHASPPTPKSITVDGRNFHYVETQKGEQDNLIVFIHGSPGGWEAYGDYLKDSSLKEKAQLISVDRLGFGLSEKNKPEESLKTHAKMIGTIIQSQNIKGVIVVGHSYGGPVASRLAMDYPDYIDGLILIAPSISPKHEVRRWYNELASWKIIRWALPNALDTSNQEILPLQNELKEMLPLWKTIKIPVTVIQGTNDKLVPKENADFAKSVLINTEPQILLLKKQGHFVIWEQYDLVKQSILDMLSAINKEKAEL